MLVRKGWPTAGLLEAAAAGAAAAAARATTDATALPGVCAAAGAASAAATARPRRGGGGGGAVGLGASSAPSKAAAEEARLFRGGGSGVGAGAPVPTLVSHDHCSKPSNAAVWRSCTLSSSQQRRHAGMAPGRDAGEAATASTPDSRLCLTRRCEPPEFIISVCARARQIRLRASRNERGAVPADVSCENITSHITSTHTPHTRNGKQAPTKQAAGRGRPGRPPGAGRQIDK